MSPFDIVLIVIILTLLIIVGKDQHYINELKERNRKTENYLLKFTHEITDHMVSIVHSLTHISTKLDIIYTKIAEEETEQEEDHQE
mgnify:CR=1 FL=1